MSGSFSSICTVCGSTARTSFTARRTWPQNTQTDSFARYRSTLKTTSSAVSGCPSCQRAFLRSVSVSVLPSALIFQDSASPRSGVSSPVRAVPISASWWLPLYGMSTVLVSPRSKFSRLKFGTTTVNVPDGACARTGRPTTDSDSKSVSAISAGLVIMTL